MTKGAIKSRDRRRKKAEANGKEIRAYRKCALASKDRIAEYKRMARICARPGFKPIKHDAHVKALAAWKAATRKPHNAHVYRWKRVRPADWWKHRYRNDHEFNLRERIRRQIKKAKTKNGISVLIYGAIKRQGNSPRVERELGYSIKTLMKHLEKQFIDGMTWEAVKAGQVHIDHIVPQSAYNLDEHMEWKACWCLSNLRPIWAKDNLKKSNARIFLI